MITNKELYWKNKEDNVGSKRPKPVVVRSEGTIRQLGNKLVKMTRKEFRYKRPDERNTKTHRDYRTKVHITQIREDSKL